MSARHLKQLLALFGVGPLLVGCLLALASRPAPQGRIVADRSEPSEHPSSIGAAAPHAVKGLAIPVAPARFAASDAALQKLPPLEHAPRSIDAVDPWTGSPVALAPLEGSLRRHAVARRIRHIDTTDPWTPQIDYAPIDDEVPGETASADTPSPFGS